ncbi:MAG: hypothetical protein V4722_21105 [Bacteroidota bacterium]
MKKVLLHKLLVGAMAMVFTDTALAQTQVSPKYSVDADVHALASHGDTLIIGGDFNNIGVYTGGGALFTTNSDQPNFNFPKIIGTINTSTTDGAGGFYVYGNFKKESESSPGFKRIEHVLAGFSFDANFSIPVNVLFDIRKLLFHGGLLYIGGSYVNQINGQDAGDLSALDVSTKQLVNWLPAITRTNLGGVFGLCIIQNTLYITGGFNDVGGQARNNIAAITLQSGIVKPWNFGANFATARTYNDIKPYNNKVVIGGYFGTDAPFNQHACALVDTTTGTSVQYLFTSNSIFTSGIRNLYFAAGVTTMALNGDTLFTFTTGTFDTRITALHLADTNRVLWARYFNNIASATAMQVAGGALYVGGTNFEDLYFANFSNGNPADIERKVKAIVKLNCATGSFFNWLPDPVGRVVRNVLTMNVAGDSNVFAGGTFSHVNGLERRGIAMMRASTQEVLPFSHNFSGHSIKAFKIKDSLLYAAGNYLFINNVQNPKSVLAFNLSTGAIDPWNPPNLGNAFSVEAGNQFVFIGGQLNEPMGGANRTNLFAIDRVTGELAPWAPNPNSPVRALHIDNGNLYVGGGFNNISNTTRNNLAEYDGATNTLTNWDPGPNGQVNAISSFAGNIYIGGNFSQVGGVNCSVFAGINAQTGAIKHKPLTGFIGGVNAITTRGCYAFLGGSFRVNNLEACNNLAVYDIFNKSLLPAANFCHTTDDQGSTVRALTTTGTNLFFGGSFTKTNGKANAVNIERISFAPGFLNGCGEYISVQNGNWHNAATWLAGSTPPESARVRVRHSVTITANARCFSLSAEPGGNVTVNAGTDVTVIQ